MNNRQSLKRSIFASFLWGILAFSKIGFSASIFVDFETNPTIINAPSTFSRAGPAQTITVDSILTFKGGVVLGFPTFQPSTPFLTTPNFYGTAYHPSGRVIGHPTLSSTLSIDIASSFGASTVEGVLLNGLNRSGSYLIEAFSNGILADSVSLTDLSSNPFNGFEIFRLESNGQPITSVIFSPDLFDGEWDYFIDTISINEPNENVVLTPGAVPIPAGFWLFATGVLSLFGMRKARGYTMALSRI